MDRSLCYDTPPLPPNTYVYTYGNPGPFTRGTYVWIYCIVGFIIDNKRDELIFCNGDNEWSRPAPACRKNRCVLPRQSKQMIAETNENGRFTRAPDIHTNHTTAYSMNTQLKFSCINHYILQGKRILTCRRNFEWDHPIPTCRLDKEPNTCALEKQPHHIFVYNKLPGSVNYGSVATVHDRVVHFPTGTSLIFACKDEYIHELDVESSANFVHCTATGRWNKRIPKCISKSPSNCILPRQLPRVSVEIEYPGTGERVTNEDVFKGSTSYKPGTRVFIICGVSEEYVIGCNTNGNWNQGFPECTEKPTENPCVLEKQSSDFRISVRRGNENSFKPDNFPHTANTEYARGEQIQFSCKSETKELVGASVLTCLENQRFDHKPPRCVTAGKPIEPNDGCVIPKQSKRGLRVFARFPQKPGVLIEMNELTFRDYVFPHNAVLNFFCIDKLDEIYANGHRWAKCLSTNKLNISRLPECVVACGLTHRYPETRIKYGGRALENAWPWIGSFGLDFHAYEGKDWFHFCGGAIISDTWFLTASHCMTISNNSTETVSATRVAVMFGSNSVLDREWNANTVQVRRAKRLILHDNYSWGPHPSSGLQYDIGLIELQRPVTFTEYVTPVCLNNPDEGYFPPTLQQGDPGAMYGWGFTEENIKSPYLLEAQVQIDFCTTYINYDLGLTAINMFCVKNYTLFSMVQGGDSGGPFTTQSDKRHYLRGVISNYGVQSSGMTNVDQYVSWIKGKVGRRLAVHQVD